MAGNKNHALLTLLTVFSLLLLSSTTQADTSIPGASCNITETICREVGYAEFGGYSGIARSGYLKLSKPGSALGFSFYGAQGVSDPSKLKKIPTILILGGGPGASSQMNNLGEMGPFFLKKVFTISIGLNKNTWAKSYNLLFVDQPVGTGVSCLRDSSHMASNMTEVISDLYFALNELYTAGKGCFNLLGIPPTAPLFIVGESYGGKYAPALGVKLLQEVKNKGIITGLKGVVIADGFTAPFTILSQLGNHAFAMGLLDYQERMRVEKILLRASIHSESSNYVALHDDFWEAMSFLKDVTGVSYHDITQDLPQEDIIGEFFANSSKLSLFGFEPTIPFKTLNLDVASKMKADFMKNQDQDVEKLLSSRVPVLVYQGQDDLIVSTSGAMKWVDNLKHSDSKAFKNKNMAPFKLNGVIAGFTKCAGKLTMTVLTNAGHFAASRAPEAAFEMIRQFITANS